MNQQNSSQYLLLTFQSILKNSLDLIFIKDANLLYIDASQSFAELVGAASPENVVGKTDFDFFPHDLAQRYTEDDRHVLQNGLTFIDRIEPLPDENGKKKFSCTSKYVLKDETGEVVGLYGIARDITAQRELEEERECRSLSRQMFEGVLEADISDDRVFRVEGSVWAKALGLVKGISFSDAVDTLSQKAIHPEHQDELQHFFSRERLMACYGMDEREFSLVTRQTINGELYKWVEFKSRLYVTRHSDHLRLTTVITDLDEEMRDKERLKRKAEIDALTGLFNRESAIGQVSEYLSGEGANLSHALLFLDLDRFKQVNDTMGHPFGDKVLQKIAERLRQLFGKDEIVGRVGGDEFMVLIKQVNRTEAQRRASEIFEAVPFYQFDGDNEIYITCSVGISMYQADNKSFEQLYTEADKAMYRAKALGKNRMMFF